MRRGILAVGVMGLAISFATGCQAADLSMRPAHHRVHVPHREHVRNVRDYDGTPIILRRTWARPGLYEAFWAQRSSPTRYLNGQPVRAAWR
jgi:transposase